MIDVYGILALEIIGFFLGASILFFLWRQQKKKYNREVQQYQDFFRNIIRFKSPERIFKCLADFFLDQYKKLFGCIVVAIKNGEIQQRMVHARSSFEMSEKNLNKIVSISSQVSSFIHWIDGRSFSKNNSDLLFVIRFEITNQEQVLFVMLFRRTSVKKINKTVLETTAKVVLTRLREINFRVLNKKIISDLSTIEDSFQQIIEHSPTAFFVLQDDLEVIYANKASEQIFGRPKEDYPGIDFLTLFRQDEKDSIKEIGSAILHKKKTLEQVSRITIHGKLYDVFCYPVKDSRDTIFQLVYVFRERTKHYALQDQLKLSHEIATRDLHYKVHQATKELVLSNKELQRLNQLKSEFVSTISHELRTPLTAIQGYISLLASGKLGKLDKEQSKAIDIIHQETQRLTNLISDILDLSRLEAGKTVLNITTFPLRTLLERIVNLQKPNFEINSIEVKIRCSKRIKLSADNDKVTQLLINLISNAIKYSEPKTKISLIGKQNAHTVTIQVEDQGRGISEDKQKHIFEPFYRVPETANETRGTGLGLAIVKHIVELHQGKIAVESKLHKGTKFILTFPKTP